jgi:hypothetical protein
MKKHNSGGGDRIVTEKDAIWRCESNIVRIKPNDGNEFDYDDLHRIFTSFEKLGVEKKSKALMLVEGNVNFSMTKEARVYASWKVKDYFFAVAVISNTLSVRLLVNFLNSFHDFGSPLKLFNQEKDAVEWLLKKQK